MVFRQIKKGIVGGIRNKGLRKGLNREGEKNSIEIICEAGV
jgi:hypothetical protein